MSPPAHGPAHTAARIAEGMPADQLETLAAATLDGRPGLERLSARLASATARAACDEVARLLDTGAEPGFVAGTLLGALRAVESARARSSIDVVWTGPHSRITTSRLTSAVVVDLVRSAREEIVLVSYAVHPPRALTEALDGAADRGVHLTLLLERPADNPRFSSATTPFPGVRAQRLAWPRHRRPAGAALHAKIIVVDRQTAHIGSANLTGHAMDHNIECGVLLHGGRHPRHVRDHLLSLLEQGELERA
jgi:cardiolipin synthase A/B